MARTHYYSIGSMLTDEEVHQVWEIVGNALDRNGFQDADGDLSEFLASLPFVSDGIETEVDDFDARPTIRFMKGMDLKIFTLPFSLAHQFIFKLK